MLSLIASKSEGEGLSLSSFSYQQWPSAPCVCRWDSRDYTIIDGDLVHFVLADTLPFASMVGFTQGNFEQPRFVYPASVLTFRNPAVYGKKAIDSPISIISVECLNFASMQGLPIQGKVETINDLFNSVQLGQGKIGRFKGESRRLLGDFDDIDDFEGMVEKLLEIEGIGAGRDETVPPPFFTYVGWMKEFIEP